MPASDEQKRLDEEIARLEARLANHPDAKVFFQLGEAYSRAGRFDESIKVCKQGIKKYPNRVDGYVALGRALFGKGKLKYAAKVLNKAISLGGGGSEPYRLLGEVLIHKAVPTQAVSLLEQALDRGFDEPSLHSLLERARLAVEGEKTQVAEAGATTPRGMGNVAVAGTIGTTGEQEVSFTASTDGIAATGASPEAAQHMAKRRLASNWSSIDDGWAQELDARNDGSFPDLGSDVAGPFAKRPRLEIQLPPLTDPMTEGMPPLPSDLDSGAQPVLRAQEDQEPDTPLAVEPGGDAVDQPGTDRTVKTEPPDMAQDDTAPLSQPSEADTPQPAADANNLLLEDLMDWDASPPRDGQHEEQHVEEPADEEEPDDDRAAPLPLTDEEGSVVELINLEPGQHLRKARRGRWLVLVFMGFALAGGVGVFGWQRYKAKKECRRALTVAYKARELGTLASMRHAASVLAQAVSKGYESPVLIAERQLMEALAWFLHGSGGAPMRGVDDAIDAWASVAARAVVKLMNGEFEEARRLLKAPTVTERDGQMRALLHAWTSWLAGDRTDALQLLRPLAKERPTLANAHLLSGHLHREVGDLERAESAYRKALEVSPDHKLAGLCLVAVLLERGASYSEIEKKLSQDQPSPVTKAWRGLLSGEHRFLVGDTEVGLREIHAALAVAPLRRDLLFHGVKVLIVTGQLDEAMAARERLQQIHSREDMALRVLDAELDLAQGLEHRCLEKLNVEDLPAGGRHLKATALLQADKPLEALRELAKDTAEDARRIKLLAKALTGDKSAQQEANRQLEKLSKVSYRAQLFLAWALLEQGDLAGAAREATAVSKRPSFHVQARTLLARVHFLQGKPDVALALLDPLVRDNQRYLPGGELQGRIYVALGRFRDGVQILQHVHQAGRRSRQLSLAMASGLANLGRSAEAAAALEEAKRLGASPDEVAMAKGFIFLAEEKPAKAIVLLKKCGGSMVALIGLGEAYVLAGKLREAQKVFARAMAMNPAHPAPHFWQGSLAARSRSTRPRAGDHFTTAIDKGKQKPYLLPAIVARAHLGMARLLFERDPLHRSVLVHLKAAIGIEPENPQAHCLLGEAFLEQDQVKQARAALERCVELAPTGPGAQMARRELRDLRRP